jgi:predicted transcriptional regulator
MSRAKIDILKLDELVRLGKKTKEIAQYFEVTPSAVSHAKRQLKKHVVHCVALEKAGEVVEGHIDMLGQLKKINETINEQLDRARAEIAQPRAKTRSLQEIIIKLSAEVRKQLEAQLRIFEVWSDQKIMVEFQREVLSVLEEMQPGVRDEVIQRLKERRALRSLVSID